MPVSDLLSGLVCGVVLVSIWIRYRHRSPAFAFWLAAYGLHAISVLLVALRWRIPDLVLALSGVPLFLGGTLLLLLGLEYYVGRSDVSRSLRLNCLTLALLVLIHVWFTFGRPSLQGRNLNLMLGLTVYTGQAAWLLLRRVTAEFRPATRLPGLVFAAFVAVGILRVFVEPGGPAGPDFLKSGLFASLVLGTNQMLFVALAFGMLLMANHRLFVWLQQDIAQRKRAEEALGESEEKFQYVFDHSPIGKSLTLPSGELRPNLTLAKMLGYAPGELQQLKWQNITHAEDVESTQRAVDSLISGSTDSARLTQRLVRKDGSIIWVDVATSLRRDEDGKPLYLMSSVMDITERKRAEEEQERLNRELTAKTTELEQLIYAASHDLRAPLVSVNGFVGELGKSLKDLDAELGRANVTPAEREHLAAVIERDIPLELKYIEAGTARLGALLAGLLKLSRLGRTTLKFEELDMDLLVADVLRSIAYAVRESGAVVDVSSLPRCVGDNTAISEVVVNLIDNAIKYRSPDRSLLLRISGKVEEGRAVYCVEDNGIGIERHLLGHVFEPFYQAEPKTSEGEGLGLTIVTRILGRLDGRVRVESEAGKGSRFYFSLPVAMEGIG
ncbi:PAS domain S-box protein [candidate division WOR-3 bacterium]|nr:PAS domain S-box protein [candidate division WOR-3 bacterium]